MSEIKDAPFEQWLSYHRTLKASYYNDGEILDTLHDAYLLHRKLKKTGDFLTKEGRICFNWYEDQKDNRVTIYIVNIVNRGKGVFSRFLRKIAEDATLNTICVACIDSMVMDSLLAKIKLGGKGFTPHACDSYWYR